ncbi:MAG: hypothetical protein IPP97_19715 [Candidatus Obscuribacter sp.]|nr:hypothetical protein [Candidatus Obscuribacter sp.]
MGDSQVKEAETTARHQPEAPQNDRFETAAVALSKRSTMNCSRLGNRHNQLRSLRLAGQVVGRIHLAIPCPAYCLLRIKPNPDQLY